jgi:hypothetical protein
MVGLLSPGAGHAAFALSDGRLHEAEEAAQRSRDWSDLLTGRDASGVYGIQMFNIRREQGRLAELAPIIRILAGDADRGGPWRPGLVSVLVELGMDAEARRELERVVDDGLDPFRQSLWLGALVYAGKIQPAYLSALAGWLIQSPLGHQMLGVSVSSDTPATATAEVSK